jgi:hypothetical protein
MATITSPAPGSNLARKAIDPVNINDKERVYKHTPVSVNSSIDSVVLNTKHDHAPFLKSDVFNAHGLSVEAAGMRQLREAGQSLHYKGADYPTSFTEAFKRYKREPLPQAFTGEALEHLESITKQLYESVKRFRQLPQAEQHQAVEKLAESGDKVFAVAQKMAKPLTTMSEEKSGQVIRRLAEVSPEALNKIESAEQLHELTQKFKTTPMGRASDAELGRAVRNLMKLPGVYIKGMQKFQNHQLKLLEQRNPEFAKLMQEQEKMHKIWLVKDKDHRVAGSLLMTNLKMPPFSKTSHDPLNKTATHSLEPHILASIGLPAKLSNQADLAAAVVDNFVYHAKQMNKSHLWLAAPIHSSFHDHLVGKVNAKPVQAQDVNNYLPKFSVNAVQAYLSSTNLMNVKLYHIKL